MRLAKRGEKFLSRFQDRPSTQETYKRRIDHFVDRMDGKPLTKEETSEWIEDLKIDLGGTSVKLYYRTIKQFLGWMLDMGYIETIPLPKLSIGKIEEVEKIPITAMDHSQIVICATGNEMWTYACTVAWATGFRLSDVALLRKEDVNIKLSTISRRTKKRGKLVQLPLSDEAKASIRWHMSQSNSEYVCEDMATEYLANQHHNLSTQFLRLAARAGVNKSFHCYRHAFITRLLDNGADSLLISKMTGISIQQILTYAHPSLDSMRKAMSI